MNIINTTHRIAMDVQTLAKLAEVKAEPKAKALRYYGLAYELERDAAMLALEVAKKENLEKAHFILTRSAAALAMKAERWEDSEEMIRICKSHNPPAWIIAELNDITATNQAALQQEKTIDISGKISVINADENIVTLKSNQAEERVSMSFSENHLEDLLTHFNKNIEVEAKELPHGLMVLQRIKVAA